MQRFLRIVFVVAAALALPLAWADDFPGSGRYSAGGTVQPDEPVRGNFHGFGGKVVVDQPIGGGAVLIGGQVEVRAPIGGRLLSAGGDVQIDAPVGGRVSAAGGDVEINAPIGGKLRAAGGQVRLGAATLVRGDASVAGGTVVIDGQIRGSLVARAEHIVLNGGIDGNARLLAERIELGPQARIAGTLERHSRSFAMADGAQVGRSADAFGEDASPDGRPWWQVHGGMWQWQGSMAVASWVGTVLALLGLLVAGAVYLLLFPVFAAEAPRQIRRSPVLSLAVGLALVVGLPLLGVLLCITLLGLPLGLAVLALYPLLLLAGGLTGALFVGRLLLAALRPGDTPGVGVSLLSLLLALVLLTALTRLPMVGHLAWLLTLLAGVGACMLQWRRRRRGSAP